MEIEEKVQLLESVYLLDRFELDTRLRQYNFDVPENEDTEKMRLLLKQVLLEEILKSDIDNRNYFSNYLKEVVDHLFLGITSEKYQCCFAGCRYYGQRHRFYVLHIKRCHPNMKTIVCNFRKRCKLSFTGIESLVKHLKDFHTSQEKSLPSTSRVGEAVITPCKCNRVSCGGRNFLSVHDLMQHWNTFHAGEHRDCIFDECQTTFSMSSMSRNHFRIKHKYTNNMKLKMRHLVTPDEPVQEMSTPPVSSGDTVPVMETQADENELYEDIDFEALEEDLVETAEETALNEEYYKNYYADFLNRLTNMKFVPMSTVQDIADEYLANTKKSLENREKLLRKSLSDIQSLSQADIEKVVSDVIQNDQFLKAQLELSSEYKRRKFIQANMIYVGPQEVVLNQEDVAKGFKKHCLHYVPIGESIRNILV